MRASIARNPDVANMIELLTSGTPILQRRDLVVPVRSRMGDKTSVIFYLPQMSVYDGGNGMSIRTT